jgi:DEAD/DEAH box helicase domain-containing protein
MDVEYVVRRAGIDCAEVGTIDIAKAMREAFPGATYIHNGQPYQVNEWRSTSYERSIIVRPVKHGARTRPMNRTLVTISHDPAEVIDQRLLTSDRGALAEINLQVMEAVEGYTIGSKQFPYRELSQKDRGKTRKQREFGTTGITIEIDEPWFAGGSDGQKAVRRMVAKGLCAVLAREKSIASSEIRAAHTSIAKLGGAVPRRVDNAIVIFDDVLGGLRLTEFLFSEFPRALELLKRGVDLLGPDALVDMTTIERLEDWYSSLLSPGEGEHWPSIERLDGEQIIFAPASVVGVRHNGTLHERRLLGHQLFPIGDAQQLMYRYESRPGVAAFVPHELIEPIGHDWRHMLWNPETNALREIEA